MKFWSPSFQKKSQVKTSTNLPLTTHHRGAIFPVEFPNLLATDISETEFRIAVILDVDIPEEEDYEPPSFILAVRYPEDYPDIAPHLDILAPPNAQPYPHFSVGDDREQLLSSLEETIQENLGMAMIFSLVSTLKESAEQLIQERKDVETLAHEEIKLALEREENKKFHGTPVTPETFLNWRNDFMREMEEERVREEEERLAELKKAKIKEPVKLTGKQLWERGLVGKIDEGDDDDGVPIEGLEQLKVEAA